ncbi:MAG: hypothetical protein RIC16_11255 [Rhodospirillales bacterium]
MKMFATLVLASALAVGGSTGALAHAEAATNPLVGLLSITGLDHVLAESQVLLIVSVLGLASVAVIGAVFFVRLRRRETA